MGPLINDFVQFHNRGVPEVRQSVDLTVDGLLGLLIRQILLVIGLYSNHMLCLLVDSSAHNCEGTLPHLEANHELFEFERLLFRVFLSSCVDDVSEVSKLGQMRLGLLLLQFVPGEVVFS